MNEFNWTLLIPLVTPVLLGALFTALGYFLRSERERNREIERQLSEKKYNTYMTVIDVFEIMFHGDESQRKENIARFNEAKRELLFYGSDDVMKRYQKYLKLANSDEANQDLDKLDDVKRALLNERFKTVIGDVLLAIRQDMGNKKTKIKARDLFNQFDLLVEKMGEDVVTEEK